MATINNSDTIKRILDDAGIQTSIDNVPSELASKVVPVLISNPIRFPLIKNVVISDASSGNVFTSSTKKRTFITGYQLAVTKDVNATSIMTSIKIQPKFSGSALTLVALTYEPLTVGNLNSALMFPYPLELTKGSSPRIENSTAVGSIDVSATLFYYEIEV